MNTKGAPDDARRGKGGRARGGRHRGPAGRGSRRDGSRRRGRDLDGVKPERTARWILRQLVVGTRHRTSRRRPPPRARRVPRQHLASRQSRRSATPSNSALQPAIFCASSVTCAREAGLGLWAGHGLRARPAVRNRGIHQSQVDLARLRVDGMLDDGTLGRLVPRRGDRAVLRADSFNPPHLRFLSTAVRDGSVQWHPSGGLVKVGERKWV
jgi:hypothetical protein